MDEATASGAQDAEDRVDPVSYTGPRSWGSGAAWTAVVGLVWVLLAAWQPTTTWYLAPLLLAGAWPWLVEQDLRAGERSAAGRVAGAGATGFGVAALVTLGLGQFDLLRGPTTLGLGNAAIESLVLAAVAALVPVLLGLRKLFRAPTARSVWVGSQRLASSDDVVMVEGNAYFPRSSIPSGALTPSKTTTLCPWKGVARYFTVRVDGAEIPDGAWSYPHPLPFARRVRGRVAFGPGAETRPE